jgi:hypothetical protein
MIYEFRREQNTDRIGGFGGDWGVSDELFVNNSQKMLILV